MLKKILDDQFYPDIFYLLTTVNPKLIDNKLLQKAETQLKINDDNFKNKLDRFWYVQPLYFGLAIYYQKINRSKSEEFYHLGNKETMNSLRYNSFEYQKNIGDIINHFQECKFNEHIDKKVGFNNIFILGTPRSGTTLIESIIGSNENATSGGELLSGFKLINEFVNDGNLNIDEFENNFQRTYLNRTNYLRNDSKINNR